MKKINPLYGYLMATLLAFVLGFFIGRSNSKIVTETKIEHRKGDPIRDTFYLPEPYEVVKHKVDIKYLPSKADTFYRDKKIYVSESIDTSKIIEQFASENKYRQTLFDNDTLGKFTLHTSVQYNQLKSTAYNFTPVYKVVTKKVEKKNTFTPFLSASYNTLNYAGVGGGLFIKNVGIEYKYLNNLKGHTGHEGGIKIKF